MKISTVFFGASALFFIIAVGATISMICGSPNEISSLIIYYIAGLSWGVMGIIARRKEKCDATKLDLAKPT